MIVRRGEMQVQDSDDTVPILTCSIARTWDDNTTSTPVTLTLDNPHMLAFFDALTSAEFWTQHTNNQ